MKTVKMTLDGRVAHGGSLMAVLEALCAAYKGGEAMPTAAMAGDLVAAVRELLCAVEDGQLLPDTRGGHAVWFRAERGVRLIEAAAALRGLTAVGVR